VPDDFVAVAAPVDGELVEVAVVNEVVVETAALELVAVALATAVPVPVVVAGTALGPAYLVQKPNASLLLAVRREKRYG
jgi:hypothetical protein